MQKNKKSGMLIVMAAIFWSCSSAPKKETVPVPQRLPVLGEPAIGSKEVNGVLVSDTIYPRIPGFSFTDQDGKEITGETFARKIYVADFFFTTCPTICPVMKSQLLRVYEAFIDNPDVMILSHTIDPAHDSVEVLKDYAGKLEVGSGKWHFVTGAKDSIYSIAEYYMVSADEDPTAPGGFVHSGALVLIDSQKRIRGYYDGTKPEDVDQLLLDIPVLLREENF